MFFLMSSQLLCIQFYCPSIIQEIIDPNNKEIIHCQGSRLRSYFWKVLWQFLQSSSSLQPGQVYKPVLQSNLGLPPKQLGHLGIRPSTIPSATFSTKSSLFPDIDCRFSRNIFFKSALLKPCSLSFSALNFSYSASVYPLGPEEAALGALAFLTATFLTVTSFLAGAFLGGAVLVFTTFLTVFLTMVFLTTFLTTFLGAGADFLAFDLAETGAGGLGCATGFLTLLPMIKILQFLLIFLNSNLSRF